MAYAPPADPVLVRRLASVTWRQQRIEYLDAKAADEGVRNEPEPANDDAPADARNEPEIASDSARNRPKVNDANSVRNEPENAGKAARRWAC